MLCPIGATRPKKSINEHINTLVTLVAKNRTITLKLCYFFPSWIRRNCIWTYVDHGPTLVCYVTYQLNLLTNRLRLVEGDFLDCVWVPQSICGWKSVQNLIWATYNSYGFFFFQKLLANYTILFETSNMGNIFNLTIILNPKEELGYLQCIIVFVTQNKMFHFENQSLSLQE